MATPTSIQDGRTFAVMADGARKLTYGEMKVKRNRISHSLQRRLPENVVAGAIYGKNSVEWLLAHQVCTIMGLRFSPINWHLVADEISYIVADSDADVVFFELAFASVIKEIKDKCQNVKLWVCMDGTADGLSDVTLEALANEAPEDAAPPVHQRKGGVVGYTGGTTGKPKGAFREGGAKIGDRTALLKEWGMKRMQPEPVQLVSAPLYHAMPLTWYSIGSAIGTTFVLMPRFDAIEALAAMERFRINGFYMPPILLKRLLKVPAEQRSKIDFSSVRTIMSGGAACPTSVKQGIVEMFGKVLFEIYGASELGAVAVMDNENMLAKPLSCGKPASGYEVILLDEKRQKITKTGQAGEIYAKGGNISGYHKQDQKTKDAKFGDYFSVGDIGYFDEDGYLYISDRKIDMIVSGGTNIYPAQVEEILHQHPDIEDVAVFGLPDEEYGERVHAALKPVVGKQLSAKDILDWCSGKIGKFQLPRENDFSFHSEDFPRSEAGKLRKKVLQAKILAQTPPPRSRM
eukprot:TRINITY_DN26316_c0_g1_i1.p1 TRINITY_DN26316_c0_g1~~TRINITY_DN26316_c0_g1_i1.p1  ORF type:complete len:517 (+),score=109.31 TRINITY_DN26316_c0_g1_i1:48-1598(+)